MILPLLPLFLIALPGGTPLFLGLLEGAADSVAAVFKLLSGVWADRFSRRKPLVVFGYALAGASRPLIAACVVPWQVLVVRLTDRVGKGVRSSPRDAMIAEAAAPGEAGRAFGFHQSLDHAGAVVGPLIAAGLLSLGLALRSVFWLAAIPGVLALLVLVVVVREPTRRHEAIAAEAAPAAPSTWGDVPNPVLSWLAILVVFSLGNATDAFLLLRAHQLGVAVAAVPLLWALLHVAKFGSAWLSGDLSDRVGRVRLIISGWIVYAVAYLCFALASQPWHAWALFAVYGAYHGLTEPAEKALVRDLAPERVRGRAYGLYNASIGLSALPAGLLTGWLWTAYGAPVAPGTGAALAAVAAVLLTGWSMSAGARASIRTTVP